jgi:hypothetical protein
MLGPLELNEMIQTVQGIFKNGKVELLELPVNVGEARVIVTFLPETDGPPGGPAFTPDEIAELQGKLEAWGDDWNAPGMEAYDDYEARRCGPGPVSTQ